MKRGRVEKDADPIVTRYRFRAESPADIGALLAFHGKDRFCFQQLEITIDRGEPICSFSSTMTLDEIRRSMWRVIDGHVMAQTVQLADEFTGERDHDQEPPPSPC